MSSGPAKGSPGLLPNHTGMVLHTAGATSKLVTPTAAAPTAQGLFPSLGRARSTPAAEAVPSSRMGISHQDRAG